MIFAPYRNVLDLAQDMNGSDERPRLTWDEIDYELTGSLVHRLRTLAQRAIAYVSTLNRVPRRHRIANRDQVGSAI